MKSIPFKTTPEQIISLERIIIEMNHEKIDEKLIITASELAQTDQGVYDLMALWQNETNFDEREKIIADIQKSINDYSREK